MVVTFCGHAEIEPTDRVGEWLRQSLEGLIAEGADTFYLGGCGAFDNLAAAVLRGLKAGHPQIQIILVLAYLRQRLSAAGYDATIYPALEDVPRRYAVVRRNEQMVQMADVVVAYVTHSWGGAAKTLLYAKHRDKRIVLYPAAP